MWGHGSLKKSADNVMANAIPVLQANCIERTPRMILYLFIFLSDPLEWRPILLHVHEAPSFSVTLHPLFILWVIGLTAVIDSTTAKPFSCVFCHNTCTSLMDLQLTNILY